jgi:phosphoenolpyruvate carboxylase
VAAERGMTPDLNRTLRVVPLFETLDDLDAGGRVMQRLLSLPWCVCACVCVSVNQREKWRKIR